MSYCYVTDSQYVNQNSETAPIKEFVWITEVTLILWRIKKVNAEILGDLGVRKVKFGNFRQIWSNFVEKKVFPCLYHWYNPTFIG